MCEISCDVEKVNCADDKSGMKKRHNVPLEEALNATGFGKYTFFLILTGGVVHFISDVGIQVMSVVIPAASCDLKLTSYQKGLLTAMGITGMLTSAHLCGVLADVYGRKKVLVASLFLQAVLYIISSFAPDALTLMICWFLYGNAAAGVATPVLVYINEFCADTVRTKAMIVLVGFGSLAETFLPALAWLIIPLEINIPMGSIVYTSWRLCLAVLSIPTIISLIMLLQFPESPKFILNQGKKDETLKVLQRVYSSNHGGDADSYPIGSIILDAEDKQVQGDQDSGRSVLVFLKSMLSQTALLFNKTFIGYTILTSLVLLGAGSTYLTFLFWIPDQVSHLLRHQTLTNSSAGICEVIPQYVSTSQDDDGSCKVDNNTFFIVVILGIAQAISFALNTIISDRMNKKLLLGIILIAPGLLCILILYLEETYMIVATLISLPVISASAYPIALSIGMRYFPTSIRSNAASVTMTFGRIGITVYSLVFGILLESSCNSAYWLMSLTFIGTALLGFLLPSKRNVED